MSSSTLNNQEDYVNLALQVGKGVLNSFPCAPATDECDSLVEKARNWCCQHAVAQTRCTLPNLWKVSQSKCPLTLLDYLIRVELSGWPHFLQLLNVIHLIKSEFAKFINSAHSPTDCFQELCLQMTIPMIIPNKGAFTRASKDSSIEVINRKGSFASYKSSIREVPVEEMKNIEFMESLPHSPPKMHRLIGPSPTFVNCESASKTEKFDCDRFFKRILENFCGRRGK
ncbi:hypothetical protein Ciccas_012775 [Cichlidogyrus casuarinus]|uniref:Uncharacterized protein n=1 Tax=Cichlidogyrus casuarinus TaxID=1844966 RepID=A0ABD2PMX6_9PLAT